MDTWVLEFTCRSIFAFKITLSCKQSDIVPIATSVVDTGGNFTGGVIDTGVIDTGVNDPDKFAAVLITPVVPVAKFAAGLIDTGGVPTLTSNISAKFRKNLK